MAAAVLAGCAAEPRTDPIPFAFDDRGVQLLDRPQRIDFGRAEEGAVTAMTKLVGSPPSDRGTCAGSTDRSYALWADGERDIGLVFSDGAFVDHRTLARGARASDICVTRVQ